MQTLTPTEQAYVHTYEAIIARVQDVRCFVDRALDGREQAQRLVLGDTRADELKALAMRRMGLC